MNNHANRSFVAFTVTVFVSALALALILAPSIATRAQQEEIQTVAEVHWFEDNSVVAGAESILNRMPTGVAGSFKTYALPAGEAYTLWWIIFNNPENCSDACGEDDIFLLDADGQFILSEEGGPQLNLAQIEAVQITIMRADGHVIDVTEEAYFRASLPVGDTSDYVVVGPGLLDPMGAEIHLVARAHGPAQPGIVDEQIYTFAGGCATFWAAPCQDVQYAIHFPVSE